MSMFKRARSIYKSEGLGSLLYGILQKLYKKSGLQEIKFRLAYYKAGDETEVSIDDTKAAFSIETATEFERFKTLKNEEEIVHDLLSRMKDDDVFFDIGANIGIYTCLIGLKCTDVVAFEPHPTNVEGLRDNIARNRINAQIEQIRLSDHSGTLGLVEHGTERGAGMHKLSTTDEGSGLEVGVKTLDSVVSSNGYEVPNVVKIDVEEAELDVLRGASKVLSSPSCRLIYCEIHESISKFGGSYDEVVELLQDHGYEIENIYGEEGGYSLIRAERIAQ